MKVVAKMLNISEVDVYYFINCFFIYSFLGWFMECVVLSIEQRRLVKDRGFVKCPLCTIYGLGAIIAYVVFKPISNNLFLLFILGMLAATLLEFITAKIMLKLFGEFWWDYNNKKFNYKGIICLESSIGWGIIAIALFNFIHPFVEKIMSLYPIEIGKTMIIVLSVVYCVDFVTSFIRTYIEASARKKEIEFYIKQIEDFEREYEPEETYN